MEPENSAIRFFRVLEKREAISRMREKSVSFLPKVEILFRKI